MKKLMSLVLSLVMVCSLSVSAFAYTTEISYTGNGTEAYEITVPAKLAPGASGTVKVEGTWASNRTVKVTADSKVTLTNSIDGATKDLAVTFAGISQAGDNEEAVSVSKSVSVANIEDALFGVWSGAFNYNVSVEGGVELITVNVGNVSCKGEEGMTWGEWVSSDYNTVGAYINYDEIYVPNGDPNEGYIMLEFDTVKSGDVIIDDGAYYIDEMGAVDPLF